MPRDDTAGQLFRKAIPDRAWKRSNVWLRKDYIEGREIRKLLVRYGDTINILTDPNSKSGIVEVSIWNVMMSEFRCLRWESWILSWKWIDIWVVFILYGVFTERIVQRKPLVAQMSGKMRSFQAVSPLLMRSRTRHQQWSCHAQQ